MKSWLFTLTRALVTLVYLAVLGGKFPEYAIDALELTAAYGILMTLLWLHERYPPRQ